MKNRFVLILSFILMAFNHQTIASPSMDWNSVNIEYDKLRNQHDYIGMIKLMEDFYQDKEIGENQLTICMLAEKAYGKEKAMPCYREVYEFIKQVDYYSEETKARSLAFIYGFLEVKDYQNKIDDYVNKYNLDKENVKELSPVFDRKRIIEEYALDVSYDQQ